MKRMRLNDTGIKSACSQCPCWGRVPVILSVDILVLLGVKCSMQEALGYINPPPPYDTIMNSQVWRQMHVNGAQIEFRDEGSGQAVVFVHGAMGEECTAVLADPVWTTGYRVIHYHRRGYGNSTRPEAPVNMAQQCNDCLALRRHMGVQRTHFVGQSYGAVIILQIINDAPEVVHTAALLEPALPSVMGIRQSNRIC